VGKRLDTHRSCDPLSRLEREGTPRHRLLARCSEDQGLLTHLFPCALIASDGT
jgi:hypothetical protein